MTEEREISRNRPANYRAPSLSGIHEIIFVTVAAKDRKPILARPEIHTLLLDAWRGADAWQVGRYVILPDHLHFFCARSADTHTFEEWMCYWKAAVTRGWPCPNEKPVWQRAYWDTRLRRSENYTVKWEYVRENPVRAGLVTDADEWPHQGELHYLPW